MKTPNLPLGSGLLRLAVYLEDENPFHHAEDVNPDQFAMVLVDLQSRIAKFGATVTPLSEVVEVPRESGKLPRVTVRFVDCPDNDDIRFNVRAEIESLGMHIMPRPESYVATRVTRGLRTLAAHVGNVLDGRRSLLAVG